VQVLKNSVAASLESKVSKQLTGYMGDDRVYYENLDAGLAASTLHDSGHLRKAAIALEQALAAEARRFLKERKVLPVEDYTAKMEQQIEREINGLLDRCYETARISTEHVERMIGELKADQLRKAFVNLTEEYAEIRRWRHDSTALTSFSQKLSEFSQMIEHHRKDLDQQELTLETKNSSK
jgi:hypothetical protein